MPLSTLAQFLESLHDQLGQYFVPDAVATVDAVLRTLAQHPAHVRLAPLHKPPATARAPLRPVGFPSTYFRMNERCDLVEIAPPLLALLEVTNPDELLGDKWEQFIELDELKRVLELWGVAAQTRCGFTHLFRFRTPSGRLLLLRERVYPLRDSETLAFHGWFGYMEPVSKVIKLDLRRAPASQQSA
jgi:hypothetical protein